MTDAQWKQELQESMAYVRSLYKATADLAAERERSAVLAEALRDALHCFAPLGDLWPENQAKWRAALDAYEAKVKS